MKSFLQEVIRACEALGKPPYDDEKTRSIETDATRRVVESYGSKRDTKNGLIDGTSDDKGNIGED